MFSATLSATQPAICRISSKRVATSESPGEGAFELFQTEYDANFSAGSFAADADAVPAGLNTFNGSICDGKSGESGEICRNGANRFRQTSQVSGSYETARV